MTQSEPQKVVEGVVVEVLPNEHYRVEVQGGLRIMAHVTGKMRMNFSRFVPGDRVHVEVSPFDASRGHIVDRD